MEIEYVTEEPEIYDPNFIFFKRIFEAFKVRKRGWREAIWRALLTVAPNLLLAS